ncbi:MAG: Cupin domain protein [Actinomycetia bacterium]|nr:Cupin domain protein [Actinomycetes bacterium]
MPSVPTAKVLAPGEGKTIMLFAVRFDYKVTSADAGGALAALEVTIPPKTLIKPHNHSREDEFTVVLAGTVGARVGDEVVEAEAGASMVKPRGVPHAMWNVGAEPARVLEVLAPGGLEDYFEELAPALRAKAPPSEYDALAHRYGLTIQNDWIEELERAYGVKL